MAKNVKTRRTLLLLRHGKATWDCGVSNFERPLKKKGEDGVKAIGAYLYNNNLLPDYILCSAATRARQTAELVCAEIDISPSKIHIEDIIYKASFMDLMNLLQTCPAHAKRILLIGHNPGLESLVFYLPSDEVKIPENGKLLPTAALATFEHEQNWSNLEIGAKGKLTIIHSKETMMEPSL